MKRAALVDQLAARGLLPTLADACRDSGVLLSDVLSDSREQSVTRVRAAFWSWLERKGFSYSEIGRLFGRDHTTISKVVGHFRARALAQAEVEALRQTCDGARRGAA